MEPPIPDSNVASLKQSVLTEKLQEIYTIRDYSQRLYALFALAITMKLTDNCIVEDFLIEKNNGDLILFNNMKFGFIVKFYSLHGRHQTLFANLSLAYQPIGANALKLSPEEKQAKVTKELAKIYLLESCELQLKSLSALMRDLQLTHDFVVNILFVESLCGKDIFLWQNISFAEVVAVFVFSLYELYNVFAFVEDANQTSIVHQRPR